MNKEIKTKWVAALRSGKYEQTTGQLKNSEGFCCLGVLCEISKTETGFGISENCDENGGDEDICFTIQQWAELPLDSGAVVNIKDKSRSLISHNDDGITFLEIADAIEEQL